MTRTVELSSQQTSGSVSVGDEILVRLQESPTTAFQWVLVSHGPGLELLHDELAVPSTDRPPGAAAQRRLRFRAVDAGIARVELALRRSWEETVSERYTATITIT